MKRLGTIGIGLAACLWINVQAGNEEQLLSKVRQLTFEGKRSGEGYFSADGSQMIFQSEREAENPFYQIYLLDLESGDTSRVSPGHGKTTCAWIHPSGQKAMFASTHLDPAARDKQKEELDFRASGKERRYSWDYDAHYDLFETDINGKAIKRLTEAEGYDAEGSYSPDGQWIAFASNREAYLNPGSMSAKDKEIFAKDKAYMMDIYIMKSDGSKVKRLTEARGYDGGPFFDASGQKICWRRFSPDGATAEIYTMNIDGSDKRQLTNLEAMSWAPYFHPSGEYLIFSTNIHGFANFELYLVDKNGARPPVRVTETDGFDGLPSFRPDGQTLSWTSNRNGKSQIFMGRWNHSKAMALLGLEDRAQAAVPKADLSGSSGGITVPDLKNHIAQLTSPVMAGRLTGTPGEIAATEYVASVFKSLGLAPAGDDGSYYQRFPFVAGVSLGEKNRLAIGKKQFKVDEDWRPLAFSAIGEVAPAEEVFAGYGISAPPADGHEEYDSFVHLDVKDKWLLVFRYMPADISAERRQHLNRHASLRYKAMVARDKGAKGLLVASGPRVKVKEELVRLTFDASLAGTSIPAVSITNKMAESLMAGSGKDLATLQATLDKGEMVMGFPMTDKTLSVHVDIQQEKRFGRNVLARLSSGGDSKETVVIGAHVDHLGKGDGGNSLARDGEKGQIHHGADDNASGVAGILEIAQYLTDQIAQGKISMKRDVLFGAWSGEELGLLGSAYFAGEYSDKPASEPLRPEFSAYLNMDMIGRLTTNVVIQGLGSSDYWAGEIERRNAPVGLPIITQADSYLPTDATSFYLRGVPILSAFTGSHEDYHSPRDTPEKLNYEGIRDISRFMGLVARGLATGDRVPEYVEMARPEARARAAMRAYLGTVPDYAQGDVKGVKLSGVAKNGPAEKAGVLSGDVIVGLAGKKIENIYDYTYAIEALKVGDTVSIVVYREGKELTLSVTPGSRE